MVLEAGSRASTGLRAAGQPPEGPFSGALRAPSEIRLGGSLLASQFGDPELSPTPSQEGASGYRAGICKVILTLAGPRFHTAARRVLEDTLSRRSNPAQFPPRSMVFLLRVDAPNTCCVARVAAAFKTQSARGHDLELKSPCKEGSYMRVGGLSSLFFQRSTLWMII